MASEKRLIDANALMDAFRKYMVERHDRDRCASEENCKVCDRPCLWQKVVRTAPTVDAVEVVHGRWNIEWEYERDCITGECDENPVATCPFCGHKEWGFAYDEYWGKPYNYCPNCGAKMDGGNEDAQ